MEVEQEVIYGTHEDSHVVMSEKVQSLAGSIYQEFEKMIGKYDEEVVKDLMPLVVNVLECLDLSYTENQEHEVELELLREDNEQLVTQYEREKQLRKTTEQKLLEVEDAGEDERKDLCSKIESLESIVRMLELKSKNSSDHVYRLEEKETEQKREYSKLHERYTELFKTHMDYMERTKIMMGSAERLEGGGRPRLPAAMGMSHMSRSSGPVSLGFASLDVGLRSVDTSEYSGPASPPDSNHSSTSLRNELQESESPLTHDKAQLTDPVETRHRETFTHTPETEEPVTPVAELPSPVGRSKTKREQRSGNTLYQELSFQDAEALGEMDEGSDITGSWVHPGEYASSVNDNFFGMGKEVENLIMENNELLATKNALNIVKDDLIIKVDELTSEQEMMREQMRAMNSARSRLLARVSELEEELRKAREEADQAARAARSDEDEDVPMAQRKRFTRVEMARVLMERNQYKERFMELQEAVRWTEMIRASRHEPMDKKQKQSVWKFFSSLFVPTERARPAVAVQYLAPTRPALDAMRRRTLGASRRNTDVAEEKLAQRRASERRDQLRQVRAHVRKDDGRLQAYGWSLPARPPGAKNLAPSNHVPVPVPVYCRPLAENQPGTKIWCAAGVSAGGGRTRDGGEAVGASVFYADSPPAESNAKLSSLVWICTSAHAVGRVTVIDANNPADILDAFDVCNSHLLCIASVPGASDSDYEAAEEAPSLPTLEARVAESEDQEGEGGGHVRAMCSSPVADEPPQETGDSPPPRRLAREVSPVVKDGLEDVEETETMSTVQGTMWLGSQDGSIYVHSAVAHWRRRLHAIKMRDAVLGIVHVGGRTVVALADGTVASFTRGPDGEWDLLNYLLVDLGKPHHSIRCLAAVHGRVWCGYRNQIHVVHPRTLAIESRVDAHPRRESQVRQLAPLGDGVWVSIRLDSTLRLFHAKTLQHLQDVDIEPYVSKMLGTGKLGFSFVRITALLISSSRLWIGTGNGVVISVPLIPPDNRLAPPAGTGLPGGLVRLGAGATVPYCSMAQAQLSFHGHRDAVKFFVAVTGSGGIHPAEETESPEGKDASSESSMLVMSGGEGYIDFRIGDGEEEGGDESKGERSHLVVWQVTN